MKSGSVRPTVPSQKNTRFTRFSR